MVEAAERDGVLKPGSILVESSSGNLGVALSMIAASKGYRFLCVTDARCNQSTRRLMEALGSQVHVIVVAAADSGGGLLGARIDYVRALCASDDRYVWLCCATIKTGHPATICHTSDGGAVSGGQADVKPEAASGGSPKG
jgi:cysteine synthase A